MKILVTGSSGHLGEALMRTLRADRAHDPVGLDLLPSPFTERVASLLDPEQVKAAVEGVDAVFHTATLHKPHVATHSKQAFVDVNVTGTLNLLKAALDADVQRFIFTSTTSTFGHAMHPAEDQPAVWVTEELAPRPRNIYGVTKVAAEELCELAHREHGLPVVILRTSRFFSEEDDRAEIRAAYTDENAKVNEFLYRRVALEDVVGAHLLALERAPRLGFDRFIISAPPPFSVEDLVELRTDPATVVARRVPAYEALYGKRGWKMFDDIERVYVSQHALERLGWSPRYDFPGLVERLIGGESWNGPMARTIGSKGYHPEGFLDAPYPVARP